STTEGEGSDKKDDSATQEDGGTDATEEDEKKDGEAGQLTRLPQPLRITAPIPPSRQATSRPSPKRPAAPIVLGGMVIEPITLSPVSHTDDFAAEPTSAAQPGERQSDAIATLQETIQRSQKVISQRKQTTTRPAPVARRSIAADVVSIDHRSGSVRLKAHGNAMIAPGSAVVVYHSYLTGEEMVAHLVVGKSSGRYAVAKAMDVAMLKDVKINDRAVCR
ncbi:MAG: hypothetical protein AAGA03_09545, partial [Planctomycetota bacterium]